PVLISQGTAEMGKDVHGAKAPTAYALYANSPNPFNSQTSIRFALPQASNVRISVINVRGEEVSRPADGEFAAGEQSIQWAARDKSGRPLSAGVYFYRMEARGNAGGHFMRTMKMLITR